jgi:hypothetical protein
VIKIGRLRWLGLLFRMQELDPCCKLTLLKPDDTRHVGKPKWRGIESGEEDLKNTGMRNYRSKYQDRRHWRSFWNRPSFTKDFNARIRRIKRRTVSFKKYGEYFRHMHYGSQGFAIERGRLGGALHTAAIKRSLISIQMDT